MIRLGNESHAPLYLMDVEYGEAPWTINIGPRHSRTTKKSRKAFSDDGGIAELRVPDNQVGLAAHIKQLRELWRQLYDPADGGGLLTRDELITTGTTFSEDFSPHTATFRPEVEERARQIHGEIAGLVFQLWAQGLPDETPTICASCGAEIRPFDGNEFVSDWCPRCYSVAKFLRADALAIESAKRSQRG